MAHLLFPTTNILVIANILVRIIALLFYCAPSEIHFQKARPLHSEIMHIFV